MRQKLNKVLGLSTEETLNRLIRLGQITHQYEQKHGEKLNLKHLEAVLHANPTQGEEHMTDDDDIQEYKKEWIGITENEVENIFNHIEFELFIDYDRDRPQWCLTFAKLVEKTLKAKNS